MNTDLGLKLWEEWFEYNGSPWIPIEDHWDYICFFCGESEPTHTSECVFVKAQSLIISQQEENPDVP